jgi:hypothetical protein
MVVATFAKNATQEIHAQLTEYKGQRVASLWVFAATTNGKPVPTKSGLSLSVDSLPELEEAVQALRAAASNPASFRGAV